MRDFTTKDLVKLGISRERLRDWINRGYINPSQRAYGQGFSNVFSELDLYFLLVFQKMVESGISRDDAKERLNDFIGSAFLSDKGGYSDPDKPFFVFFRNPIPPSKVNIKKRLTTGYLKVAWFFMDADALKEFAEKHEDVIDDMVVINFRKIRKKVENLS